MPLVRSVIFWITLLNLQLFADTTAPSKYRVCKNNQRAKYWAQLNVDSDLMEEEMKRLALAPGHTRVAVIDSGFDDQGNRSNMATPVLELLKANKDAGPADQDKDGHGTMVSGLIGGGDGIGIAPEVHLSVYRVTPTYGDGIASRVLNEAVLKACEDGNEIINVSWGSVVDEAGLERNEVRDKEILTKLRAANCLVIKSAGNSAYRKQNETDELGDAYLRVAALNTSSTLSSFSSRGEVGAPGSFVFTLESTSKGHTKEKSSDRQCEKDSGIFTNGTSFSSPITAAIAARILGVLKSNPESAYSNLTPDDKQRLIPSILQASEVHGTISGLRALMLTERWLENPIPLARVNPETLAELLTDKPPAFCHNPPLDRSLTAYQKIDQLRRELSVCPNLDQARSDQLTRIIRGLIAIGNAELAIRWVAIANTEKRLSADLRPQIQWLWKQYRQRWATRGANDLSSFRADQQISIKFGLDFDEAIALSVPFLSMTPSDQDGIRAAEDALELVLGSYSTEMRLSRRDGRGSEDDIEKMKHLFQAAGAILGKERVTKIVKDWSAKITAYQNEWQSQTGRQLLTAFRILDALQGAEAAGLPEYREIELDIYRQSNATNKITLERIAKETPTTLDLAFYGDLNNFHIGYLDPFFERHQTTLFREVGLDRGEFHPEKLNPFFLIYFLKSDKVVLSADQREQMLISTLGAVADHRGWNMLRGEHWYERFDEDDKIAESAREGLQKLHASLPKEAAQKLQVRYRQLFVTAGNLSFYRAEMPFLYKNSTPEDLRWKLILDKNPMLDRQAIEIAIVRLLKGIPLQTSEFKIRYSVLISEVFGRMLPVVPELQIEKLPPVLFFPYFADIGVNRLEPSILPLVDLGKTEPSKDLMLHFARNWLELLAGMSARDWKRSYAMHRPMEILQKDPWACPLIGADPESQAHLSKLAESLKQATYETHGSARIDVTWIAGRLRVGCRPLTTTR